MASVVVGLPKAYVLCVQPRWSDLDVNQHVNNVKYVGWILEVSIFFALYFTYMHVKFPSSAWNNLSSLVGM